MAVPTTPRHFGLMGYVCLSAFHICMYNMYHTYFTPTIQSFIGFISQYGTGCGFRDMGFGVALLGCGGFDGVTGFGLGRPKLAVNKVGSRVWLFRRHKPKFTSRCFRRLGSSASTIIPEAMLQVGLGFGL